MSLFWPLVFVLRNTQPIRTLGLEKLIIKANWWRPIVKFHLGQMPLLYSFPLDTSMSVLSINTSFEMQREKHPTLVSMQSGETRQCLLTCINMDALRQSK